MPKGLIDRGERGAETAVREVLEETGLRAVVERKLGDVRYIYTWGGVVAPKALPKRIVDQLQSAIAAQVTMPTIRDRFSAQDAEMVGSSPAAFGVLIRREIERWAEVIQFANVPKQ